MARLTRQTKQKEILHQEMQKINSFFTADELFAKINKVDKKIGIATLYRFLKNSTKKGKLHSYFCGTKTIYSREKKAHCHFTCERCGAVAHFDVKNIDFMTKSIRGEVCHFQIDVFGICDKCKFNAGKSAIQVE